MIFLCSIAIAQSNSPKAGQWKSVGGKIAFSGEHSFKNKWHVGKNNMYWKNDEDRIKTPATHPFENEVKNDVIVKMGQITVRGPGHIGAFIRSIRGGSSSGLTLSKTGKEFPTASLGRQALLGGGDNWNWHDIFINDFDPNRPGHGWIPANKTVTLDVWATSVHTIGTWFQGYDAPRGVECEYWFFPQDGGEKPKVGGDVPGTILGVVTDGGKVTTLSGLPGGDEIDEGPNWDLDEDKRHGIHQVILYIRKRAKDLSATDKNMSNLLNLYAERISIAKISYKDRPNYFLFKGAAGQIANNWSGTITLFNGIHMYHEVFGPIKYSIGAAKGQLSSMASLLMHEVAHTYGANEWQSHLLQQLTFDALGVEEYDDVRKPVKKYFNTFKSSWDPRSQYLYWMFL